MDNHFVVALLFLFIGSIFDLKTRKLPLIFLLFFGGVAVVLMILGFSKEPTDILARILPGILLLMLGFATREGIGYGDGAAAVILGLLLGWEWCIAAVMAGFFLSTLCAAVLLMLKRVNGKSRIPYIPFLTVGLVVMLLGN